MLFCFSEQVKSVLMCGKILMITGKIFCLYEVDIFETNSTKHGTKTKQCPCS